MYQRRVRPYPYNLPQLPQVPHGMMAPQGISAQTTSDERRNQQQLPNVPSGLLKELLSSGGSGEVTPGFLSMGAGPSAMESAAASAFPSASFSTPYLDSLIASGQGGSLVDAMASQGAFDMGTGGAFGLGGAEAGTGFGMGAGEAGLLGSGAATGATAAGEGAAAGTAGSAASSAGMMGPWAPITIAAMIAKSQVQGSDPSSPAGVLDTLLLPSIDQWMANPVASAKNTMDPIGTALGNVTGQQDFFSYLNPAGFLDLF